MSIIKVNAEKIKRFLKDASKLAYHRDLKPMGARSRFKVSVYRYTRL